jgi:hypothetical protein
MDQQTRQYQTGSEQGSMTANQSKMRSRAQKTFAAILISTLSTSFLHAQQNPPPQKSSSQAGGVNAKLSDKERQSERARELYADAAVAQKQLCI